MPTAWWGSQLSTVDSADSQAVFQQMSGERRAAEYVLRVQVIRSKGQAPRCFVNVPIPLAAALDLQAGEQVQSTRVVTRTAADPARSGVRTGRGWAGWQAYGLKSDLAVIAWG
jgi:hypothetical protein